MIKTSKNFKSFFLEIIDVYKTKKDLMIGRQSGRYILDILGASELYKTGPECNMELSEVLRKRKVRGDSTASDRCQQFLEAVRAQVDSRLWQKQPPIAKTVTAPPPVRTYQRKTARKPYFKPMPAPQATSTSSTAQVQAPAEPKNEYLKFIPPNLNTLVATRALLSSIPRLKSLSREKEGAYDGNKRQAPSDVLKNGLKDHIFFGLWRRESNMQTTSQNRETVDANGRLTPEEADRRLRNRFLSLFMWPGLMSITKPTERTCHLFDLGEEGEVAADKPMNAQQVIEESRIRAANAPKVIVISKEEIQEA